MSAQTGSDPKPSKSQKQVQAGPKRRKGFNSGKDVIHGITKPAIRRLARRGGVKRIARQVYDDSRGVVDDRLDAILKPAVILATHSKKKVLRSIDVAYALKELGTPMYGIEY